MPDRIAMLALGLALGLGTALQAQSEYQNQLDFYRLWYHEQPGREGRFVFQNTTAVTQNVEFEVVIDGVPRSFRVSAGPYGTVSHNGGEWGPMFLTKPGRNEYASCYFNRATVLGWPKVVWTSAADMTDPSGNRRDLPTRQPIRQPWHFLITEQTKGEDYRIKSFTLDLGRTMGLGIP